MESFNKNWLAILLIVFVFFGMGFIFGWILKPNCSKHNKMMMKKHMMMNQHGNCYHHMNSCCGGGMMDHDVMMFKDDGCDSIENIDVQVWVDDEGNVTKSTENIKTKVIVKKVEE